MKIIPLFALILALLPVPAPGQSCTCTQQFDWLRQKLALNYSGYRDKVTAQNQAEFDRYTAGFAEPIAGATADSTCLRLLTEWARWFHDGHVQLVSKGPAATDPAAIRQQFSGWEKIVLSETRARSYFDLAGCDSLEGIYQNTDGSYRVALIRSPTPERDFVGVILKADSVYWTPGQIKFEVKRTAAGAYTGRYFMRDHSQRQPGVTYAAGRLEFEGLGAWYRQYPGQPVAAPRPRIFTLEQLDSATLLLTVPTMNESVRQELDSLVRANGALLDRTPRLIIDCRDNGGGSDITFHPLRPYVYSGKVTDFHAQTYATEDNLQKYERLRTSPDFPKAYRRYFAHMARKMRRHKGAFIGKCGTQSVRVKHLKSNPQRVAILINGGCASSCEQFIYYARQSKRVTLIGQHTAGIMDYGNLHTMDFPCPNFALAYPTSRSCRVDAGKGIDGAGLAPDVLLSAKDGDWVQFARAYLANGGGQ